MGDAFDPEPQGAFLSFLDWIDKPGQVVRNSLKGNFKGAAKNFGDFLLDPIDAALPGDWIPELAGQEDKVSGSDLVGIDKEAHPVLGFLGDVGVGILTDPLSLLGVGIAGNIGKGVAKAATGGKAALKVGVPFTKIGKEIPGSAKAIETVGNVAKGAYGGLPQSVRDPIGRAAGKVAKKTRLIFDAPKVSPEYNDLLQKGMSEESLVNQAGGADVQRLVEMLPDPALRQSAFDVANNLKDLGVGPGRYDELLPGSNAVNPLLDTIPVDAGDPLSDIARQQPVESSKQVAKAKVVDPTVDPLDEALGIQQQPIFEQAYPSGLSEDRYASGIELANRDYIGKGKVKTYGEDPLKPSPSELPREATGEAAIRAAQAAGPEETLVRESGVEGLLGKTKVRKGPVDKTPLTDSFDTVEGHYKRYKARIDALSLPDTAKAKLLAFWGEALPHVQEQFARDVEKGIMFRPQGRDIFREMPADYVHRRFTGMLADKDLEMLGNANSIKERVLPGGVGLAEHLSKNPDINLDRDVGSAFGHRVQQDARMTKSAVIGKGLIDKFAKQADEKIFNAKGDVANINLTDAEQKALTARGKALAESEHRDAVTSIIDEIEKVSPHTDDATMLRNGVNGLAPRGWLMHYLAHTNREYFKPFAVAGAGIAKVGTNVRNAISSVFMTGANPESRAQTLNMAKNVPKALLGGLADGIEHLTGYRIGAGEFDDIEAAMRASRGDPQRALAMIKDPLKREAVQLRVLDDGFINTEDLLKLTNRVGWAKWLTKVRDWPAAFFKGVEQRLRWALFKGLRTTERKTPEEAARITRDSLYDYRVTSTESRAARDLIPFFRFQSAAIPQTAKLIKEQPSVGVALSQLMQDRGDPVYPWMQGKTNIPVGNDEEGNDLYATGLGLPFESLNMIPASFRDVKKNIVGSSHPILKSLFAATSGEDPFFETPYGSYDKIPAIGDAGEIGQLYNKVAQTGMIQPLDALLRVIGDATDDRHSLPERLADVFTGVNIASVDPDRALQQLLQQELETNPDIKQFRSFYDPNGDPEAEELLRQFAEAKKKTRAKRAAQAEQ